MATPSTTTYRSGDLLLIEFPFSGSSQVKTRPAMVVLDTGDDDVVVARVTTRHYQTSYDVSVGDWQAAGLLATSTVRLRKIATLEKKLILANWGNFNPPSWPTVLGGSGQFRAQG